MFVKQEIAYRSTKSKSSIHHIGMTVTEEQNASRQLFNAKGSLAMYYRSQIYLQKTITKECGCSVTCLRFHCALSKQGSSCVSDKNVTPWHGIMW